MSKMDDSALYTGVDEVKDGVFGNEKLDPQTQQLVEDQKRQLAELTPKLQSIVTMLDNEIAGSQSVKQFTNATSLKEKDIRSELQAIARYCELVEQLKTKFALALGETRSKDE